MRWKGYWRVFICAGILILLLSTQARAVPVVTSDVTPLSGGVFRYSYILTNSADSIESIFDFGLHFFEGSAGNVQSPVSCDPSDPFMPCWDFITGSGFVNWFSTDFSLDLLPGADPLAGFSFDSPFSAGEVIYTTQGRDPFTCVVESPLCGITVGPVESSTAIPEPATLLLLGSGLAGVGLLRRRLDFKNGKLSWIR